MKKILFGIMVIVFAAGIAAFTRSETSNSNDVTYWFPTDSEGNITSNTISVSGHTAKPCNGAGDFCALGFTEAQVIDNQDGTVTLREDVEPLDDGLPSLEE